jgi:hypothetical protein
MTRRATTWSLWLVLICTVPVPYFMIETGRVPALQLFVFAAVTLPLVVTDPGFTTNLVAALFATQALLYGIVLYVGARWIAGWTAARVSPRGRILFVAAVALVLGALGLANIYRAPLSHGPGATNIVGALW